LSRCKLLKVLRVLLLQLHLLLVDCCKAGVLILVMNAPAGHQGHCWPIAVAVVTASRCLAEGRVV